MGPMSYEGPEKYIFISYAHKDSDRVLKILERLTQAGYRIWYDDGIAPGSEWPEDIAQHLNGCAVFMAFVSENSIASANCRREVTFALSRQKDFLGIILEPTKMSLGMEMQLSAQQCILRQNYRREEDFIQKIFSCPDLDSCREVPEPEERVEEVIPTPAPKPKPVPKKAAPKKKNKLPLPLIIAGGVLLLALIVTPIVLLASANAPLQVAEGVKVSRREDSISLRGKVITKESAEAFNQLEKLKFLYFHDCTFEDGALDTLSLPDLMQLTVENADLADYGFLMDSPKLQTLNLKNCGVKDGAVPFEVFEKLEYLAVTDSKDFTSLTGLNPEKLRRVELYGTGVKDISPLAGAKGLSEINCADSAVTSIDPLAELTNLRILNFNNCKIQAVVAEFKSLNLREVHFGNNGMTDAGGFKNATVLQKAYFGGNALTDLAWLGKSRDKLQEVDLHGNPLTDVSFLQDCAGLTYLNVSSVPMEDLQVAQRMSGLKSLYASGCGLKSIAGIEGKDSLSRLRLNHNALTDLAGLPKVGGNKNAVLDLANNQLTDASQIPEGEYIALSMLGNPWVYESGDLENLKGRVAFDYDESLLNAGGSGFTRVLILNCPLDKQLEVKGNFSGKAQFLSLLEIQKELEQYGNITY